jgi:hypothetical protein
MAEKPRLVKSTIEDYVTPKFNHTRAMLIKSLDKITTQYNCIISQQKENTAAPWYAIWLRDRELEEKPGFLPLFARTVVVNPEVPKIYTTIHFDVYQNPEPLSIFLDQIRIQHPFYLRYGPWASPTFECGFASSAADIVRVFYESQR